MEGIAHEAGDIRALLGSLTAQAELAKVLETRLTDAAVMLAALRDRIDKIDRTDDVNAKREVVELLVERITAYAEASQPHERNQASITLKYLSAGPKRSAHNSTHTNSRNPAPRNPRCRCGGCSRTPRGLSASCRWPRRSAPQD